MTWATNKGIREQNLQDIRTRLEQCPQYHLYKTYMNDVTLTSETSDRLTEHEIANFECFLQEARRDVRYLLAVLQDAYEVIDSLKGLLANMNIDKDEAAGTDCKQTDQAKDGINPTDVEPRPESPEPPLPDLLNELDNWKPPVVFRRVQDTDAEHRWPKDGYDV